MKKIKFICKAENISEQFQPIPASKLLPDWYKNTETYKDGDKRPYLDAHQTRSTIKKCIPVFDSMSIGYFLLLPWDLYIEHDGIEYSFSFAHDASTINFHPNFQANLHPDNKPDTFTFPKFSNPWAIETPPGYSCMIVPPMHRENIIQIFPGIVDTDKYNANVNLPFFITKNEYTGIIKAGTPIAQVIPFKRESWSKTLTSSLKTSEAAKLVRSVFFEGYKNFIWSKKIYK